MTRYIDGGAIDLDAEEIARANRRGRPSLSSTDGRSPQISVRVPSEVHDRLRGRARDEGKRLSDVVREALAAYVSR